jgi:hypothetical protein
MTCTNCKGELAKMEFPDGTALCADCLDDYAGACDFGGGDGPVGEPEEDAA